MKKIIRYRKAKAVKDDPRSFVIYIDHPDYKVEVLTIHNVSHVQFSTGDGAPVRLENNFAIYVEVPNG